MPPGDCAAHPAAANTECQAAARPSDRAATTGTRPGRSPWARHRPQSIDKPGCSQRRGNPRPLRTTWLIYTLWAMAYPRTTTRRTGGRAGRPRPAIRWPSCGLAFCICAAGVCRATPQAARLWLQKAANKNNPKAELFLGTIYFQGDGVPRDYQQAMGWYKKAAAHGNPERRAGWASCTSAGWGLSATRSKRRGGFASRWRTRRAATDHQPARPPRCQRLGIFPFAATPVDSYGRKGPGV